MPEETIHEQWEPMVISISSGMVSPQKAQFNSLCAFQGSDPDGPTVGGYAAAFPTPREVIPTKTLAREPCPTMDSCGCPPQDLGASRGRSPAHKQDEQWSVAQRSQGGGWPPSCPCSCDLLCRCTCVSVTWLLPPQPLNPDQTEG